MIPHSAVDRVTVSAGSSSGDSDEQLIRRYIRGDKCAFGHLLARYRQRIVTLVRYRLGSRSLWVEDVAQDVFLQVHRKAPSFEGRSTFKTWLFGVALNVCRDHLRRERRAIHVITIEGEGDAALETLPCESLNPLEMLERTDRDALVRGIDTREPDCAPAARPGGDVLRSDRWCAGGPGGNRAFAPAQRAGKAGAGAGHESAEELKWTVIVSSSD